MELGKPSWLKAFLDAINIHKGDWIDITIPIPFVSDISIQVPPWDFLIGAWIETGLDTVLDVIQTAIDEVVKVMATVADIYAAGLNLLQTVGELIEATAKAIWKGITDLSDRVDAVIAGVYDAIGSALKAARREATDIVKDAVSGLWDQVDDYVQGAIDATFDTLREQINIVVAFGDDIKELFTDPEKWLLNKLEAALDRFW